MADTTVQRLLAWEALDSRGSPTVGCELTLRSGASGTATVPSGASKGVHEALELRDGGERYGGLGVDRAVANAQMVLAEALGGVDAEDQQALDRCLREADGTPDLAHLGANAVLAVSVAAARAVADHHHVPLHRRLSGDEAPLLPMPMVNILSGGAHAGGAIDLQDFLVVPVGATTFREALEWCWSVRRRAQELATERDLPAVLVADEGGLGLPLPSNRAALDLLEEAIERAGLEPGTEAAIAIDVAATELHQDDGSYRLATEGRDLTAAGLVDEIADWVDSYPIASVEDVLAEDDWTGWSRAMRIIGNIQVVGDDLFATSSLRVQRGIDEDCANAVLVKPNQRGTLSDAAAVVTLARSAGWATVVSARSGDTEDSWLADLAVGWRSGQIKVGSTMRSERTAKWNRLLQIEASAGGLARFAGVDALAHGLGGSA